MHADIQGLASFTLTNEGQHIHGLLSKCPKTGLPRLCVAFEPDVETREEYVACLDFTGPELIQALMALANSRDAIPRSEPKPQPYGSR